MGKSSKHTTRNVTAICLFTASLLLLCGCYSACHQVDAGISNIDGICLSEEISSFPIDRPDRLTTGIGQAGHKYYVINLVDEQFLIVSALGGGSANDPYDVFLLNNRGCVIREGRVYLPNGAVPTAACGYLTPSNHLQSSVEVSMLGRSVAVAIVWCDSKLRSDFDPRAQTRVRYENWEGSVEEENIYFSSIVEWDGVDIDQIQSALSLENISIVSIDQGFALETDGSYVYEE